MENNSFVVTINNTDYTIKLRSVMPRLYDVLCGAAYHQIGKTDAGLWVYVENPTSVQHMPLQEIGEAIDEHSGSDNEETY
ncbi:hypothetical protein [Mucilaginibacter sp. UR6-11]|uniref:hypothetical protein n=1 Tax=Mucilaginibacter sp. UR6-11 TaxID=1435644 RepID=UPI001E51DF48|nr:hypothetical protein [Mucilaginibacter sp. UR6-11]MCC8423881.1 hypothetical protein [Mucilaginibacter sp. UR6-11]